MPYSYGLAGDVTGWTHPAGFTITNTISAAQRITEITSTLSDSTHPPVLAQNLTYTPWGALNTLENGCVGTGCTPPQETYTYNNRLQVTGIQLSTSAHPSAYSLTYNYSLPGGSQPPGCPLVPAGSGNNGNVIGYTYTDTVSSGMNHSALYVYDTVNRLACAQATGSATYNLAFTYDRYGNMACQTNGQTNGPCPNWTFNSSANQITTAGYTYDAAGNVTSDNLTNYQWDAEGRLISVNSGALRSFIYNALGRQAEWHGDGRVSEVLTDLAGHVVGSVNPSGGGWESERIPGGRMELAWYVNGGTTFPHYNALGSTVMNTRQDGNTVSNDILFYPWGQLWASPGNDYLEFFGSIPNWDWEIGEGVTPNRYYPNTQGRWLSPDPLGQHAADPSDPQTWNMYAYVRNNPTTLTDPLGLQGEGGHCGQSTSPRLCAGQYYGHWESGNVPAVINGYDIFDAIAGTQTDEQAYAGRVQAVWDSLYVSALLQEQGVPSKGLQAFLTTHPDVTVSFGLLGSATYWGKDSIGAYGLNLFDLYGYSVVGNPLALAGMMAEPLESPWAPVAWYGGSAAAAGVAGSMAVGYGSLELWAMTHPNEWLWTVRFLGAALNGGPPTTWATGAGRAARIAWNWWWNN